MTPEKFKQARVKLGLSVRQLGVVLGTEPRSIRKWEADPSLSTSRNPNPIACKALEWFLAGYRPADWPTDRDEDDA